MMNRIDQIPRRSLTIVLLFTHGCWNLADAQSLNPVVETLSADQQRCVTFLNPEYLVFPPDDVKPGQKIPLVIYLHGAGGVGDDATKNSSRARVLIKGLHRFNKSPCLVVAPQCRRTSSKTDERGVWLPEDLDLFLHHLKATHPEIDAERVYLTGNSMGGYGCWVWGGHHPEHFAAIAPIVGGIGRKGPKDVTPDLDQWAAKLAKVPVYAFAGAKDRVVPAERSQRMVAAIRKAGGTRAKIKIYPEEGHGASKAVFSGAEYFDWMFSQRRTSPTVRQPIPTKEDDVAGELARMLDKYPAADANGDGKLTEDEAGDYILRIFQRKRPNRGPGIRDRSLIDVYEARSYRTMPYRLMKPIRIEAGRRYPLVISLHGSGGIGDDNLSNLRFWNGVMAQPTWREEYACFVLVPQRRPGGYWGPKPDDQRLANFYVRNDLLPVFRLIDQIKQECPIDASRIYAIGSSGGGVGTWNVVRARPDLFAAAIPVCGRFPAQGSDLAKLATVPIWCFHGDADPLVDVKSSRWAFAKLTEAGGLMKYTELRGVRHNSWIQAFTYEGDDASKCYLTRYSSDRCDRTQDVWKWLFRQRRPQ